MVRFKSRWVLFYIEEDPIMRNGEITYPKNVIEISEQLIYKSIAQAVESIYGVYGKAMLNISVKWYNPVTRMGILKASRDYLDVCLSSMFFMKKIADIPCNFTILQVSGTIIFIQTAAIELNRDYYIREQAELTKKGQHVNIVNTIDTITKQIQQLGEA
ncbi:hypothetical protein BDB01DRAFT_807798 [Pilobolus umbonatus]|nr:hypothetical protein BDB01DRAFT_807798 [Pilobolus umbonatus]